MSGGEVSIDEGRRKMIMDRLGLNDPIIVQYGNWLKDIFSGDLGVSLRNAQPLREVFLRALPVTVEIGVIAAFIACIFGIPLGISSLSLLIIAGVAAYVRVVTVRITLTNDWISFIPALLFSNFIYFFSVYRQKIHFQINIPGL
jgi:peptide/nickel transport system permease protein